MADMLLETISPLRLSSLAKVIRAVMWFTTWRPAGHSKLNFELRGDGVTVPFLR